MGSILEQLLAFLFNKVAQALQTIGGWLSFKPLRDLFYNATFNLTTPSPFTKGEWARMDEIFAGVLALAMALMIISVISTSVKFMSASVDAGKRQEATESMWRWIGAVVMMAAIPVLARVLCNLNNALVIGITDLLPKGVIALGPNDFTIKTDSPLVDSICVLFYTWQYFTINLMYMVRDWVIFIMYAFGPIAVFLWSINKEVTAYAVFIGELMSNIFLQSAYALVGLVVLSFITIKSTGDANQAAIMKLIGITMMTPMAKTIRNGLQGLWVRWAGVDEEHIAKNFAGGAMSAAIVGADSLGRLAGTFKKSHPSDQNPKEPPGNREPNELPAQTGESSAQYTSKPAPAGSMQSVMLDPEPKGDPKQDIKYDYTPENTAVFGGYDDGPSQNISASSSPPQRASTFNPVVASINAGRMAYTAASTVTQTALGLGAGMIPGGKTIAHLAGMGVGKIAQAGVSTVALAATVGYQAWRNHESPVEVLKHATGTTHYDDWRGGAFSGLKTAGAVVTDWINPNWTPALANLTMNTNLDNYHKKLPLKL